MIKLFIFDYDGLIVNSEQVVFAAIQDLFSKYGKDITWDYYTRHIGTPVHEALAHFHRDHFQEITLEEFSTARNQIVTKYLHEKLELMPGLLSLLKFLKKESIELAIATSGNRDYIQTGLNKFKLSSFFKTIVCIDDVNRGKPHPDLVLKVLHKTGFKPEEAALIEDSYHGIESARRAKVHSIAVPTVGVSYDFFKDADIIVKDLNQLMFLLQNFI